MNAQPRRCFFTRLLSALLIPALALPLTLPAPALALRELQPKNSAGLEQKIATALGHPTAGAEELDAQPVPVVPGTEGTFLSKQSGFSASGLEEWRLAAHPDYPFPEGLEADAQGRIHQRVVTAATTMTHGHVEQMVLANLVTKLEGHLASPRAVSLQMVEEALLEDIQRDTETGAARPDPTQRALLDYLANARLVPARPAAGAEERWQAFRDRVIQALGEGGLFEPDEVTKILDRFEWVHAALNQWRFVEAAPNKRTLLQQLSRSEQTNARLLVASAPTLLGMKPLIGVSIRPGDALALQEWLGKAAGLDGQRFLTWTTHFYNSLATYIGMPAGLWMLDVEHARAALDAARRDEAFPYIRQAVERNQNEILTALAHGDSDRLMDALQSLGDAVGILWGYPSAVVEGLMEQGGFPQPGGVESAQWHRSRWGGLAILDTADSPALVTRTLDRYDALSDVTATYLEAVRNIAVARQDTKELESAAGAEEQSATKDLVDGNALLGFLEDFYLRPDDARGSTYGIYAGSKISDLSMLFELAGVGPGRRFSDLGSGDGRVPVVAALFGAVARGIEGDQELYDRAVVRATELLETLARQFPQCPRFERETGEGVVRWVRADGGPGSIELIHADYLDESVRLQAEDVVYWYSTYQSSERVLEKVQRELQPGKILIHSGLDPTSPVPSLFEVVAKTGSALPTEVGARVYRALPTASAEEREALGRLVDGVASRVKAMGRDHRRPIIMIIDPEIVNLTPEAETLFRQGFQTLPGYPVVTIERYQGGYSDDDAAYYRDLNIDVIRLVAYHEGAEAHADVVQIQGLGGIDELTIRNLLPAIITGALAAWSEAQGKPLANPIVLDVAPYLNIQGLTVEDVFQVLSERFA